MEKNKDVIVQVTGGGSGTGIAALISNSTDICQASRPKINFSQLKNIYTGKIKNWKELGWEDKKIIPISRYLYFYIYENPREDVKKFIDFVLSEDGQKICKEVGFFPIK